MLVTKIFAPVCFAMFKPVAICLEPAIIRVASVPYKTYNVQTTTTLTAAQRMPQRDGAAVQVHLLERDAELLDAVDRLARERLVDLEEVDLLLREPRLLQHLGDRVRGPDAHDPRRHADDGGRDVLADDGQAEAARDGAAREEDGGGAVGYLGCVTYERS